CLAFLRFFSMFRLPPTLTLFPYTTLFRSWLALAYFPPWLCSPCWMDHTFGTWPFQLLFFLHYAWPSSTLTKPNAILLKDCLLRRSEEHTSELQSRENLVCRLLLEKKNKK